MDAARTEILSLLRRRKHKEAPEKLLVATKLRSSRMGWPFHLRDMVGKGLLERAVLGQGENTVVYRIVKR